VYREPRDAVVFHDNGAVVPWGMGVEEAQQQRDAELAVEPDPTRDVGLQRSSAVQHNQGAATALRQSADRPADYVDAVAPGTLRLAARAPDRELLEEPTQVVLEDDDHHQHQSREEPLEDPYRKDEVEDASDQKDRNQNPEAAERQA
jgi:hypothetical protein